MRLMEALIYNKEGRILRGVSGPEKAVMAQRQEGEFIYWGNGNDELQYIKKGELNDRPQNSATLSGDRLVADGRATLVLDNLPRPCVVVLEAARYPVEDGVFEFSVDQPGTYLLQVADCFPYLDKEFNVEGFAS